MKKVLLCIMDGIGIRKENHGNAVRTANTNNLNMLLEKYPHSLLEASGNMVGLPKGQMGNSEVGHTNIGAGRIVYQPLELITNMIETKKIYNNENINEVMNHVKENDSKLHLLGLLSDGGVHSHIDHLFGLLDMCKDKDVKNVYIHVFTDGRDTLPNSGIEFIKQLQDKLNELGFGKISSISGRYYAMDRDNNWDRIRKCYDVIVNGLGRTYEEPIKYMEESYQEDVTDEFIKPMLINKDGIISNNDGILTFNFRPDRLRELFKVISNKDFNEFPHKTFKNIKLVTMMPVSDEVVCKNAFEIQKLDNTLGEYLSNKGLKQLRIAETEKYAHVTYFFDGGVEKNLFNCDRVLIPSPKVATYDLKPEMSAYEITDKLFKLMKDYDFIVLNFANGDMVGHTGVFDATVKAVEVVDECVGMLYTKCMENGFTLVITADHGNSDYMLDENNNIITSHSTSLVPFIITDDNYILKNGKLADIAPTILDIMNMEIPNEMTGDSLIK
ncbi:MAG: 2,3-bisphosphoglycerate-independent phosphoglycerate mutase [Firmicutes bacterium]|nr:2,3-bisphosphoglycerate-independent phosphoglycerate mutase [Bacillota bacterium]